jgi:plasmid stability protein
MAQFVVRERVKARLKRRAERNGRSMEEEIRHILRNAVKESGPPITALGSRIAARFSAYGLSNDLSELRGQAPRSAEFKT